MSRNYGVPEPMWYDKADVKNAYSSGFWIGSLAGGLTVFFVCLLLGLYLNS